MAYAFDHLDEILEVLKRSPFGLIADVDGTISQIAPTPEQASVTPKCRKYLTTLRDYLHLVAAISGRPATEVRSMVGIDGLVYIGNHGMERWKEGHLSYVKNAEGYVNNIKEAIAELSPLLSIEGVRIEDKGVSATIHYRLSPEPESASKNILTFLNNTPSLNKLRIVQERKVIDLLPPIEVNKGTALTELLSEYFLKGGIYLGDDRTDINAFRAIHTAPSDLDFHGLAIGIISEEMPDSLSDEVDFTLKDVSDVERFLKWICQTVLQSS